MKMPNITPGTWFSRGEFVTNRSKHIAIVSTYQDKTGNEIESNIQAITALPNILKTACLLINSENKSEKKRFKEALKKALIKAGCIDITD